MTEEVLQILAKEQLIKDFVLTQFISGETVFIAEKNVQRTKKIIQRLTELQFVSRSNSSLSMGISDTEFRGNVEYYDYSHALFILVKSKTLEGIKPLLSSSQKVFFHEKIERGKKEEIDWHHEENLGRC